MHDDYETLTPVLITSAVAFIIVFTVIMFVVYDRLVERRQKLVLTRAVQSTAIVSSLFPKAFRDRLIQGDDKDAGIDGFLSPNHRLKSFLSGGTEKDKGASDNQKPIADMFPHATVLFTDVSLKGYVFVFPLCTCESDMV
jgi:hypothetical protein